MSTIQELYQHAQVAEAAYARFDAFPNNPTGALEDEGFGTAQATTFLQNWRVVWQFTESGLLRNGFSATLFERLNANQQPTGQYTLAFAGSTQFVDFVGADLDLAVTGVALNQLVSMVNYVLRLKAGANGLTQQLSPIGTGLTGNVVSGVGPGINPAQLTVSGHSLGGYLSQVYQRIFGSAGVYTYNALGIVNQNASIFDRVTGLLGLPEGRFSSGPGENLLVPGEPAQLIGTVQGKPQIQVFSETQSTMTNPINTMSAHRIAPLTDSLALYDLLANLDPVLNTTIPAVGIGKITDILKAASNKPAFSLEATLDSLRKLFRDPNPSAPTIVPTVTDNREQYYQNLIGLQDRVALYAESLTNDSLVTATESQLAGLAQGSEAIAYRYALKELNPFAVVGNNAIYDLHNTNGDLDLYNTATGTGALTNRYLADRAEMLGWKNLYYQKDGNVALRGDRTETLQFTDRSIKDDRTGQDLTLTVVGRNSLLISNPAMIIFGGDADETLVGSNIASGDHIYGSSGADTLQGNQGNDYLEGGGGDDTYVWNTDDGFDTILDTDGIGWLLVNGRPVSGGIRAAQGDYVNAEHLALHFEGDPIAGGVLIVNGDLRIENFKSGHLGIVLSEEGGLADIQPTSNLYLARTHPDDHQAYGSVGNDHFVASGGVSLFLGNAGNDLLEGHGFDALLGGAGDDVITSGTYDESGLNIGDNILSGGAGSDVILGGIGNENIVGDIGFATVNVTDGAFYVDWLNYGVAEGQIWFSNPGSDYGFRAPDPIFFDGGFIAALDYVLGISDSTDISTLYNDWIDAGDGDDTIHSGLGSDAVFGGNGNDIIFDDLSTTTFIGARDDAILRLFGSAGDDYLDGGAGNDRLTDQNGGNDVLIGGPGNDYVSSSDLLSGEIGHSNYLEGGEGNDRLFSLNLSFNGHDTLVGGPGDDRLTIQFGSAYVEGGLGSDNYVYFASSGNKLVIDDHDDGGSLDRLYLVPSFDIPSPPSDLVLTRDEANLYLSFGGMQERITVLNWFAGSGYKIEQLVIGGFTNPEGSDVITPRPGSQIYDVATIENRFTTSTEGNDSLWGSSADNQFAGGLGNDTLFGGEGKDTLAGNGGTDTLDGGEDGDTYAFIIGDGVDYILDTGSFGGDAIAFGPGITPEMLTLGLGSLLIKVGESGDAIHIEGFDPTNARDSSSIELFQFADGTQLTYEELVARGIEIVGTGADDVLRGTNVNDRFTGGAGNDTYFFVHGFGQDVIEDLDSVGLDTDTVLMGADIAPADLAISQAGDFIAIVIDGTSDQLSIRWEPEQGYGIERVEFSGGTVWDAAALEAIARSGSNTAPTVANPLMDQAAQKDVLFGFQVPENTFRDMDLGEILNYSAALANGDPLPPWLIFDVVSRKFSGKPAATDVGTISIRVTASDQAGASATDDFQLVVSGGGECHEMDVVGSDHCDSRDHDHGNHDGERPSKLDGRNHDGRDDDRWFQKGDRIADCLAAYVGSKPRYDFEALARELEHSDRHGEALNAREIARRWQVVDRYASALANDHDEDARGGADCRLNYHSLLSGSISGGGFGYSGSTGAPHRVANLQTLQGLAEGFHRLHS